MTDITRLGPTPLPIHLALATSVCMQKGPAGQEMLQSLMTGIKKYQAHPYKDDRPELPVFWKSGEVRIFKMAGGGGRPLFLLPSMINKAHIFDLLPERSFLRWMAKDRDVFLLDWGESTQDRGQRNFDSLLRERLLPGLKAVSQDCGRPLHTLGYCMGGTLLAAAAQLEGALVHSAVFLAAPWDFKAGDQVLSKSISFYEPSANTLMGQRGLLPSQWIQTVFANLDPQQLVRKFSDFAGLEDDDPKAVRFVAVEEWLNNGVDLPERLGQGCLRDWYKNNLPAHGNWQVCGTYIRPKTLQLPALIVTAERDRLVPPESAKALAGEIEGADYLEARTGHIGLIAGERSVEDIWQPIANWLGEKE